MSDEPKRKANLSLPSTGAIQPESPEETPVQKNPQSFQADDVLHLDVQRVERYSGPIPHPAIVERYELALPGSADRILSMAEERQRANIELERMERHDRSTTDMAVIRGLFWNHRIAMFLFVGLALVIIVVGTRIIELGHSAEGFAMIAGTACGVIVAFIRSYNRAAEIEAPLDND